MATVRTVLGEIAPSEMGVTLTHEHLLYGWGSAVQDLGPRYNREALIDHICNDLGAAVRDHGVKTVVDATAAEAGRNVDVMAEVARRLNVHLIASTGYYVVATYWSMLDVEHLVENMVHDVEDGVGQSGVKCGVLKLATNTPSLTPPEEKAFRAAARAQQALKVPIVVHTGHGTWQSKDPDGGPLGALDLMLSEGADPSHIQISHCDFARGDLGTLTRLAERGCYLSFDNIGQRFYPEIDETRLAMVSSLLGAGFQNRVHFSMDHISAFVEATPKMFADLNRDFSYMHREFIPELLQAGLSDKDVQTFTMENPKTLFTF